MRVVVHQVPAQQRPQVVTDDRAALHAQGADQLVELAEDEVGAVAPPPYRLVRVAETLQVEGDHPEVLGQGRDLVPPGQPAVGEAVQEEDEGLVPGARLDVVEFYALENSFRVGIFEHDEVQERDVGFTVLHAER